MAYVHRIWCVLLLAGCTTETTSGSGSTSGETTENETVASAEGSTSPETASSGDTSVGSTTDVSSTTEDMSSTSTSDGSTTAAETSSGSETGSETGSTTGETVVVCGDGEPDVDGVCVVEGISHPVPGGPVAIVAGDFNDDGTVDLATANLADDSVSLVGGDGVGGFYTPIVTPLGEGAQPVALAAGLLSDDGVMDVLVANSGLNSVSILHGSDAGFSIETISVAGSPSDVAIADLDGMYGLDFAVVNTEDNVYSTWTAVDTGGYLLADINDGGPIPFIDTFAIGNVAVAGALDVVFSGDLVVGASPGNGDGSIGEHVEVVADVVSPVVQMRGGDVNDDGELDVVLAEEGAVTVLVGDGDPSSPEFDEVILGQHDMVMDAVLSDVTGEGNEDVIAVAQGDGELVIYPGHGDGTFGDVTVLPVGDGVSAVTTADLDGDGAKEIVIADETGNVVTVFVADP